MNERARQGWARFHAWHGSATAAISPEILDDYISHLDRTVQPKTAMEYLWGLLAAARERHPIEDWGWMERRLRAAWQVSPARPHGTGPGRGSASRRRRQRLTVDEWPEDMRAAWRAARTSAAHSVSLLDEIEGQVVVNDVALLWSDDTVDQRERAMGAYLRHLSDEGLPPAVNARGVESYVAALTLAERTPKTVATRIVGVLRMAEAMWPARNWRWLQNRAYGLARLADRTGSRRTPATQFIPLKDLRAYGRKLMAEARRMPPGRKAAAQFQEGLILIFLTHHPVRRRNLTRMDVVGPGFSTREPTDRGWLRLQANGCLCVWPRTKSRPRAEALARPLLGPMLEWLARWRPHLAGETSEHALWLSNCPGFIGEPLTEKGMYEIARRVTTRGFGLPIGPHAFRYIIAMTIVEFAPLEVGTITTLLGHRNPASKRFYIQAASSAMAARLLERIIQQTARLEAPDLRFLHRRQFRLARSSG